MATASKLSDITAVSPPPVSDSHSTRHRLPSMEGTEAAADGGVVGTTRVTVLRKWVQFCTSYLCAYEVMYSPRSFAVTSVRGGGVVGQRNERHR